MIAKTLIYCAEVIMTTTVKWWLQATGKLFIGKSIPNDFHYGKRYIYIANHASYMDVLVMWSVLNIRQRLNGAPTKVMTAPSVFYSVLRPFIWLLGAYPAKKRDGSSSHAGVEGSLHYLNAGYNIAIFPEGKRSLPEEKRAFNGVSRILANSDRCEMILIHIVWTDSKWWKRKVELRATKAPSSLDHHDPFAIMDAIYKL